jgi:hypothetical protein
MVLLRVRGPGRQAQERLDPGRFGRDPVGPDDQ